LKSLSLVLCLILKSLSLVLCLILKSLSLVLCLILKSLSLVLCLILKSLSLVLGLILQNVPKHWRRGRSWGDNDRNKYERNYRKKKIKKAIWFELSSNTITTFFYKLCSHGWSREGTIKCIFGWMWKTTLNGNAIDSFKVCILIWKSLTFTFTRPRCTDLTRCVSVPREDAPGCHEREAETCFFMWISWELSFRPLSRHTSRGKRRDLLKETRFTAPVDLFPLKWRRPATSMRHWWLWSSSSANLPSDLIWNQCQFRTAGGPFPPPPSLFLQRWLKSSRMFPPPTDSLHLKITSLAENPSTLLSSPAYGCRLIQIGLDKRWCVYAKDDSVSSLYFLSSRGTDCANCRRVWWWTIGGVCFDEASGLLGATGASAHKQRRTWTAIPLYLLFFSFFFFKAAHYSSVFPPPVLSQTAYRLSLAFFFSAGISSTLFVYLRRASPSGSGRWNRSPRDVWEVRLPLTKVPFQSETKIVI